MVLILLLGYGFADLRSADLLEDLVDFSFGGVALEHPFLFAAGIGTKFGCFGRFRRVYFRKSTRCRSQGVGIKNKIVSAKLY